MPRPEFDLVGIGGGSSARVVAAGSHTAVPPIPGMERVPYYTNETLFALREPVAALIVVGAGPIGCEMAQAFARLGTRVSVVDVSPRILPREDSDLSQIVRE